MDSEENNNISIEDLVSNESFRSWVNGEQFDSSSYWDQFKEKYPEKTTVMAEAKSIILATQSYFSKKENESFSDQLVCQILQKTTKMPNKVKPKLLNIKKILSVAAMLCLVVFGFRYWVTEEKSIDKKLVRSVLIEDKDTKVLVFKNGNVKPRLIILEDGSNVLLNRNSLIKLPEKFESKSRPIFLEGSAYFEVAENRNLPMRIYSKDFTVEVIGTRFTLDSDHKSLKNVGVYDGEVRIFESKLKPLSKKLSQSASAGLQWSIKENELSELIRDTTIPSFQYSETPLVEVLDEIDHFYGTKVVISLQNRNKRLTASLGDEPLERKLELIALALDLEIELKDNIIKIK